MASYHLNPKTGNPGVCSAEQGNCPFGAEAPHFDNKAAARQFYEDSMLAHTFAKAKKKTEAGGVVPLSLRLDYSGMMLRRTGAHLYQGAKREAILLSTGLKPKDRPGPRNGSIVEAVKKLGSLAKVFKPLTRLPFVKSTAGRLIGYGGAAAGALMGPAGLAIGGGVVAVGAAVAVGTFGKKTFDKIEARLLQSSVSTG